MSKYIDWLDEWLKVQAADGNIVQSGDFRYIRDKNKKVIRVSVAEYEKTMYERATKALDEELFGKETVWEKVCRSLRNLITHMGLVYWCKDNECWQPTDEDVQKSYSDFIAERELLENPQAPKAKKVKVK